MFPAVLLLAKLWLELLCMSWLSKDFQNWTVQEDQKHFTPKEYMTAVTEDLSLMLDYLSKTSMTKTPKKDIVSIKWDAKGQPLTMPVETSNGTEALATQFNQDMVAWVAVQKVSGMQAVSILETWQLVAASKAMQIL